MFEMKRNSSSTRNLSSVKGKKELQNQNNSQTNLLKVKRPPLSNLTLMRSQSNLLLYKKEGASNILRESKIGNLKSPELGYKTAKLSDLKSKMSLNSKENSLSYTLNQNHLMMSNLMTTSSSKNPEMQPGGRHNSVMCSQLDPFSDRVIGHNTCKNWGDYSNLKNINPIAKGFTSYYVCELQHKDGKLIMYKEICEKQIKENNSLKSEIKTLKDKLNEEKCKVEQLKEELKEWKQSQQNNKENVHTNLRKSIQSKISQNGKSLWKSKSKMLIQKKNLDDTLESKNKESSHSSDVRRKRIDGEDSDSDDTSHILSSLKKRKRQNSSWIKNESQLDYSSEDLTQQKDESVIHCNMQHTPKNNYDLQPYWTEMTNDETKQNSEEKYPQPEMVNDGSPILLKDQKARNQTFLDFQK
jgi:Fe-S cluster biosynthesis and repair protein YggX